MSDKLYTEDQLRLALLEQSNTGVMAELKEIKQDIKSNFHWTMGTFFGLFISFVGFGIGAIGKAYSWF